MSLSLTLFCYNVSLVILLVIVLVLPLVCMHLAHLDITIDASNHDTTDADYIIKLSGGGCDGESAAYHVTGAATHPLDATTTTTTSTTATATTGGHSCSC